MKDLHLLAEVTGKDKDLHIYINSDIFTNENNAVCVSYDNKELAYCIKDFQGIDWLMGLIGRDTQNWSYNNIVIHWGDNEWKFYNRKNVSFFDKETIKYFDVNDYDY